MKLFTLLICATFLTLNLLAQKIEVSEVNKKMSQGSHNGIMVVIPETDRKNAEKAWKKLMKKEYDASTGKESGDIFADDAIIGDVSENTVDVYAFGEDDKGATKFYVFFNLGGAYLSSAEHGESYKEAAKIVREFAVEMAKETLEEKLDDEEDNLKDLEKDLKKLEKDNEDLHGDIEDYKQKIKEAEKGIEENKKNQEQTKKNIEKQKQKVKEVEEKLKKVK